MSITRIALCLWIAQTLAACDSGASVELREPAASPGGVTFPPGRMPPRPMNGYFRGEAEIGDSTYYVDALITVDGAVRMHFTGPFDEGPVFSGWSFPVLDDIAESVQFVGSIERMEEHYLGEGVVLGQTCAPSDPGRFCDVPAPASISLEWQPPLPGHCCPQAIAGEVGVTTSAGEEIWHLDVSQTSIYYGPESTDPAAVYRGPTGMYQEELALFAETGEVVVTIDSLGRLFFQSPESECIGNGTLRPRPDGSYYTFDAEVLIETCGQGYAFLNGEYQGLAIGTLTGASDDPHILLLMFLSAPEGFAPRAAITMLGIGPPVPCGGLGSWGWCY
jgi:hypothetical protein